MKQKESRANLKQKAWKTVSNIQDIDNSMRNKEKFMSIHNKNTQLLTLTTFRSTKKLF